ncbi:hypothetical protein SH2C18_18890 [Clostridium sediminicola]
MILIHQHYHLCSTPQSFVLQYLYSYVFKDKFVKIKAIVRINELLDFLKDEKTLKTA